MEKGKKLNDGNGGKDQKRRKGVEGKEKEGHGRKRKEEIEENG